jgi:hypothetical protein
VNRLSLTADTPGVHSAATRIALLSVSDFVTPKGQRAEYQPLIVLRKEITLEGI